MCFLDIVTFWYDGVKIVDFEVPSQPREYQPVRVDGLSRAKVNYLFGGFRAVGGIG